jgi:hypothetical protein
MRASKIDKVLTEDIKDEQHDVKKYGEQSREKGTTKEEKHLFKGLERAEHEHKERLKEAKEKRDKRDRSR